MKLSRSVEAISEEIVMTLHEGVEDDQLGQYYRRTMAIADRLGKSLSFKDVMEMLQRIHDGEFGQLGVPVNIIDCDANPFIPDGWKVEEHRYGGPFKWDTAQVQLFLAEGQQNGKTMDGNRLRKDLAGKPVLNANVLDYLLANPHLIPEEWKGKTIFFWGTVYRDSDGYLCVRCLRWNGDRWDWDYHWLGYGWLDDNLAALRAS